MNKIGFIGLGNMGKGMAMNLSKKHFDRKHGPDAYYGQ